jgi:hypothetical protein
MINIEEQNICELYRNIKNIEGVHTGASPTDAWIIFLNNVKYNNKKIKKVFAKIFINLDNKKIYDYIKHTDENLYYSLIGLEYEVEMYKTITPIVNYNICPNFVRFIGFGKMCMYDNLFKMLNVKQQKRFDRNIKNNMLTYHTKNYALGDATEKNISNNTDVDINVRDIKFNIILTETFENYSSFHNLLVNNQLKKINIANILFQALVACYTLSLSKIAHNDLHSGNIIVKRLKSPINIVYVINNEPFIINTYYKVYMYDWDRGYCKRLGDNNSIKFLYKEFSQINTIIDNKDILKLMCHVYKHDNDIKYLKCLTSKRKNMEKLLELYDNKRCNFRINGETPVDLSFFSNYNKPYDIIVNFYQLIPYIDMSSIKIDKKDFFVINEKFFNKDGGINIKLMKNVFKETYIKYENNIQSYLSLKKKKKKKSRNPISVSRSRSRSKSILKRKTKNKSLF